jgi:hypothetical protein
MLNPARDPPMTPTAYMLQQQVLKALRDVPNGAPWINKAMFVDMVNQPNTFQYAIAPKLNPSQSSRITGEDGYIRHIRNIFERFARQDKQDIFLIPAQYFLMPNEPFKRVFRHTGTIPTHERPNLVADRHLLEIMQLDRQGDSEGVARMLETTPDLDEPAAEPDDDPEPMSAPASSSGQMIMQEPFYAAGVAPPRVADRAEPTAAELQAVAGMRSVGPPPTGPPPPPLTRSLPDPPPIPANFFHPHQHPHQHQHLMRRTGHASAKRLPDSLIDS